MKGKVIFPEFFKLIANNDIFALSETFVTERDFSKYNKYFGGFALKWIGAVRDGVLGRASGGMLMGFKCGLDFGKIGFCEIDGMHGISVQVGRETLKVIPVYLNYSDWNNNMERLTSSTSELSAERIVIIGDFNARIGAEQDVATGFEYYMGSVRKERRSRDIVVNAKGRKFMEFVNDMGMIVLNGRMNGDLDGELTFLGNMGESVIDYACVTWNILNDIESFEVLSSCYSDHMPIVLNMKLCGERMDESRPLSLLPGLRWGRRDPGTYASHIRSGLLSWTKINGSQVMKPDDLVNLIRSCVHIAKSVRGKYGMGWYDWECEKARRESFKQLNVLRNASGRSDEMRERYKGANRYYKDLCITKRKFYIDRLAQRLDSVYDSNEWWKLVREIRGESTRIGCGIGMDDLRGYFERQFAICGDIRIFLCLSLNVRDDFLDNRISMDEIARMVQGLKDGKAGGDDGITAEFFKYAPVEFMVKLCECLNYLWINEEVDDSFNRSLILPIHKKGDVNDVGN